MGLSGRDEKKLGSPPGTVNIKVSNEWAASSAFSSVCNQQPLDLSSGVKQKAEGQAGLRSSGKLC